jgi:DNA modification methylase
MKTRPAHAAEAGEQTTVAGPEARWQVQWVPLDSIHLNPDNPRLNDPAVEPVMNSIARFGFRVPIVVNRRTNLIEAGNTRWKAAQRMGLTEVPVIFADDDEVTALAFALADNRTAEIAQWDEPSLADLLKRLDAEGELAASGFGEDDLGELLARLDAEDKHDREESFDVAAALEAEGPTRVQPGELWQLGRHRLLCADSTDPAEVARLMEGTTAGLLATDPPYGVSYDGNQHRRQVSPTQHGGGIVYQPIANDDLQGDALETFLAAAFSAALPHISPDAAWYVWHASRTRPAFLAALTSVGVEVHQEIVWVKEGFQFGRSDYHWQHEPCLYGWRDRHTFLGERNQSTVWSISRQTDHEHPTTKPTELWETPMRNHLHAGEVCLDLFAGSGTAVIAAERTGACARVMELDAHYASVIVERWEAFTGQKAVKSDG